MPYGAQIVADSISERGDRVTTMEITYPRFVHSELMTHRVASRNAASSRAIPIKKTIGRVLKDPAMPVEWGSNRPGMQAGDELTGIRLWAAKSAWLWSRYLAVGAAKVLTKLGVHKQIVNRLLEPWVWITVIVTATDWDGFFQQRSSRFSPLAQPELRHIADMMLDLYETSVPTLLPYGEWHLPFIFPDERLVYCLEDLKAISAARCARVSYLTHNGTRSPEKDIELYRKLVSARPAHWSPLEHVCTPSLLYQFRVGNLTGFDQFRHEIERSQL